MRSCAAPPDDPAPERTERSRLVLIGVDSLSWALADPLLEAGELPHLAALRERGWSADLTTVEPLISLEEQYGQTSYAWLWYVGIGSLLALTLVVGLIVALSGRRAP